MFEDATFHSGGIVRSQTSRWMFLTCAINLVAVGAFIMVPLVYPDGLPSRMLHSVLFTPVPPPVPMIARTTRSASVKALDQTSPVLDLRLAQASLTRVTSIGKTDLTGQIRGDQIEMNSSSGSVADSSGISKLFPASTLLRVVRPAASTITISRGVAEGLLVTKTAPVYPAIAKAAGISGTVVLAATISKGGTIDNIRILSGNPMLQQSALQAIRTWRYRPYLLNGQPVEVEATISIVFSMGNR